MVKQFEYDEHHRMINSLVKQGKDEWVAQYEYDALSRRISKTSQYYTDVYEHHRTLVEYKSKKQLFYWQGLRLAGESEASHTENRRWYAYEENSYAPLALIDHWHEIDRDEVVYYHNQLNGSPYALSNTQGELIFETETYLWGSYRRPAKNQVTLLYGQPLRFQGQYFDQGTGLHYNTFRYYAPETGRFTQQDPIGLAGGINLYQYAPNPLSWVDPLGWIRRCNLTSRQLNNKFKRIQNQLAAGGDRGVTGAVSESDAMKLAERFLGPGYRKTEGPDFDILISADNLRQFRTPTVKYGLNKNTLEPWSKTGTQVNFQSRDLPSGKWLNNVHLDIYIE